MTALVHCKICNAQTSEVFRATVLSRHKVGYWSCEECGLLATEKPYWLDEAYADAIAAADTGLVMRNLQISRRLAVLLLGMFGREGHYVDMAGGTGLLVRLMRDMGFDFRRSDPYCKRTLERIGAMLGLRFHTYAGLHMLTKRNISPLLFRALTGRAGRLSLPLVRRLFPSKTEQDSRAMLGRAERTEG